MSFVRRQSIAGLLGIAGTFGQALPVWAAEGGESHSPNYSSLIWYIVNFTMYAIVIRILFVKKGSPALEQRAAEVKKHVEKAALDLARAEENLSILQRRLKQIAVEKGELIESYEREAKQMGEAIIAQAHTAASRITADGRRQADTELSQAEKEIRHEVVAKAMNLAKQRLSSGLSAEDDQRLREQILREALF